jgi:hypothetical protein
VQATVSPHWIISRQLHLVPILTTTAAKQLINTHCRFVGFNLSETTGSAGAVVDFWDGHGTTGVLVGECQLAQGTSQWTNMGIYGWPITAGLYMNVVSGSVLGSVTIMYYEEIEIA